MIRNFAYRICIWPALVPLLHRWNDVKLPIEGTGLLHAMWLYRNHSELETLLEQVAHPTDDNLHAAGLVRTTAEQPTQSRSNILNSYLDAQNTTDLTGGRKSIHVRQSTYVSMHISVLHNGVEGRKDNAPGKNTVQTTFEPRTKNIEIFTLSSDPELNGTLPGSR
ncbi:hypothetical protein B0H19DRAFT_1068579 [Mycena capillaripes]|nr:hypothetical protein B0H19DRAFT_1068579 [Mycena capillaripes]